MKITISVSEKKQETEGEPSKEYSDYTIDFNPLGKTVTEVAESMKEFISNHIVKITKDNK